MSDIIKLGNQWDQWEDRIRATDGKAVEMIIERGKAWLEVQQDCKAKHGKQGGSEFSKFAQDRFGISQSQASEWVRLGQNADELIVIADKFSEDRRSIYDYTRLEPEQKQALIESGETIDRKAIKALTYNHTEGDEWYTPKWLFNSLGIQFSIDVCSPEDRTHVATPADRFFTEKDDGLAQPWDGTIWCNPPYSSPEDWALKCIEHGDGLLLSHVPMNAAWCSHVWQACGGMRLFQAMRFRRPDGTIQRPGYWLQLASFGTVATEALAEMEVPELIAENPREVPSPVWVRR